MKSLFAARVKDFRLPRYGELPNMGLYLEQVTKYINGIIVPLGCTEITSSMVSNYVKKDVISPPVKKQYYAEQIAYLIFISMAKSVLSLENIAQLFKLQRASYEPQVAYDYFCCEIENMLMFICGLKDTVDNIGVSNSEEKNMLRSAIIAVSHTVFINNCFNQLKSDENAPEK